MRRLLIQATAVPLILILCVQPISFAGASRTHASRDMLTGSWEVHRDCVTGCGNSQTVTITVTSLGHNTYSGTGSQPLVLVPVSATQVIVHARRASSVLTVQKRGKYMVGVGVGTNGETFKSTWRCVSSRCGS